MNLSRKCVNVRDVNVTMWFNNNLVKITVNDVCSKFGIDIENDRKNRFFWNIQLDKKVVLTEELLNWLGYGSEKYYVKKHAITNLLKKNRLVRYSEITMTKEIHEKNTTCWMLWISRG